MPEFAYTALAKTGSRTNGTLTAVSEREAMAMLDARGLFPVRIEAAKAKASSFQLGSNRRIRSKYMAPFYSQLADLLRSGVPLLRSLDILERQSSNPSLSEVVREVRSRVADGTGLAEAMSQHPKAFNELAVSMVKAGQEGGFLEDVLKRIADFTEHQEDLKAKVVGALAYPAFLATIGFIVLMVLILIFVPLFEPIFKKLEEKGELPTITELLMDVSHFMQRQWLPITVVIFLGVVVYHRWAASERGRLRLDAFKLRLPGMGHIYLNYALSRFTRILGTLLKNGIPILRALKIAEDATGNRVLTQAID